MTEKATVIVLVAVIAVVALTGIKSAQTTAAACERVALGMTRITDDLLAAHLRALGASDGDVVDVPRVGGASNPSAVVDVAVARRLYVDARARRDALRASGDFDVCGVGWPSS